MTDDRCGWGWWCVDGNLKPAILWYSGQFWFDSVAYCSSFNVVSIYACIVGTSYQCNEAFCRSDPFWCLHHVNPESDTPNNLHRSPRGTRVKNLGLFTGAGDDHVWNFGKTQDPTMQLAHDPCSCTGGTGWLTCLPLYHLDVWSCWRTSDADTQRSKTTQGWKRYKFPVQCIGLVGFKWRQDVDFAVSQQTPHDPAGPYAGVWSPKCRDMKGWEEWLMYFHLRNACEMQPDSIRLPWRSFKNSKLMTCKTFEKNVLPKILRLANPPRSCFKSTHQSPSKRAKSVGCPGLSLPLFFTTLQISTYYGNSETLALKHQEIRTFHFNCAWISVSCCLDFKSSSFIRTKIPIPFSSRACSGAVSSSGDTRHFQRFAECIGWGHCYRGPHGETQTLFRWIKVNVVLWMPHDSSEILEVQRI